MDRPISPLLSFEDELRRETQRVLESLIFQRSPVQSQLLRYLLARTLEDGPPPTQYEIAVDGLGKDPDFDLANDSYPRVQMSRLRSNLDSYYAREAPGNGLRLVVEAGRYVLDLERVAPASAPATTGAAVADPSSPEEPKPPSPAEPEAERVASPPAAPPASGSSAASPRAVFPPDATASTQPATPPVGFFAAPSSQDAARGWFRLALLGLAALVVMVAGAIALSRLWPATAPVSATPLERPTLGFAANIDDLLEDDPVKLAEARHAARMAEIQLAYSWVSQEQRAGDPQDAAYRLRIDFVELASGALSAYVELTDRTDAVLFTERLRQDPAAPERFEQELIAALVFVTSPTGVIASDQRKSMGDDPRSGYECFITTEMNRADGLRTAALVDSCLSRFPQSEYRPFLLARRAFSYYQQRIMEGRPILRSGQGWDDLQAALDADRFNAFANFTASKVELANNNCKGAQGYVANAFERSVSYPALIVAIEAEASACNVIDATERVGTLSFDTIVRNNPAPDPLLHLYLLLGLLGTGDRGEAVELAERMPIGDPSGIEEQTIALLQQAIADPGFARENAARLREEVRIFVWGERGVEKIMQTLVPGAADQPARGRETPAD